jgi:hypothetical protein
MAQFLIGSGGCCGLLNESSFLLFLAHWLSPHLSEQNFLWGGCMDLPQFRQLS